MPSRGAIEALIDDGLLRYGRGDVDGALLVWEQALSADPDNEAANSYVDYVRQNYDVLTGADPTSSEATVPFGIADDEYTIEISGGEWLADAAVPARAGIASALPTSDEIDEGWFIAEELVERPIPVSRTLSEDGATISRTLSEDGATIEISRVGDGVEANDAGDAQPEPKAASPLPAPSPSAPVLPTAAATATATTASIVRKPTPANLAVTVKVPLPIIPALPGDEGAFEAQTREYDRRSPDLAKREVHTAPTRDLRIDELPGLLAAAVREAEPAVGEFAAPATTPGFGAPPLDSTPTGFATQSTEVRARDLGFVQAAAAVESPMPAAAATATTAAATTAATAAVEPMVPAPPIVAAPRAKRSSVPEEIKMTLRTPAREGSSPGMPPLARPPELAAEPAAPGRPKTPTSSPDAPRANADHDGELTVFRDIPSAASLAERVDLALRGDPDERAALPSDERPTDPITPLPHASLPTRDLPPAFTGSVLERTAEIPVVARDDRDATTTERAPIPRSLEIHDRSATRELPPRARTPSSAKPPAAALQPARADDNGVSAAILAEIDRAAPADEAADDRTRRRITTLIERAKAWQAFERDKSVAAVELALTEEPNSALAQKLVHRNRDAILSVFQGYLGDLSRAPVLARPLHELASVAISPRAAFLLSRVDGTMSIDEVLDVSGMPRLEAYRYLCQLLLRGILR